MPPDQFAKRRFHAALGVFMQQPLVCQTVHSLDSNRRRSNRTSKGRRLRETRNRGTIEEQSSTNRAPIEEQWRVSRGSLAGITLAGPQVPGRVEGRRPGSRRVSRPHPEPILPGGTGFPGHSGCFHVTFSEFCLRTPGTLWQTLKIQLLRSASAWGAAPSFPALRRPIYARNASSNSPWRPSQDRTPVAQYSCLGTG
jgi:hypothetical protein